MTASTQTGGQHTRATAAAEVTPAARGAGVIATVVTVAMRGVRTYMRTPQLLVFNIIGLATFGFLFRYIFGGSIHLGPVPYVDFLVPGFVLTSVLITGTGVAAGVAENIEQGSFDRLRSLPVPRVALAAGQVAGDTVIVAWGVVATVAMGFAAGRPTSPALRTQGVSGDVARPRRRRGVSAMSVMPPRSSSGSARLARIAMRSLRGCRGERAPRPQV